LLQVVYLWFVCLPVFFRESAFFFLGLGGCCFCADFMGFWFVCGVFLGLVAGFGKIFFMMFPRFLAAV